MFRRYRERKLLKMLRYYGIEKDVDDIKIERIKWGVYGGLLVIYRAITTDIMLRSQLAVSFSDTSNGRAEAEQKARMMQKDLKLAQSHLVKVRESFADVFRVALLKPNPKKHDMSLLADNPEIGHQLYADILANSVGSKKKAFRSATMMSAP